MKDLLLEGFTSERYAATSLHSSSTKNIYISYTETMPPPKVEFKYPDRDWSLVWKRLDNGVLSQAARNQLFFIGHERFPTRERLNRILPNKVESPYCLACPAVLETQFHKFTQCSAVSDGWRAIRELLESIESDFLFETEHSLLHLYFVSSRRENAALWIIGEYVSLVETEVFLKGGRISQRKVRVCGKLKL